MELGDYNGRALGTKATPLSARRRERRVNFGNNIMAKATSISCFWNSQVNLDSQFEERRESAEPTKVSMKPKRRS